MKHIIEITENGLVTLKEKLGFFDRLIGAGVSGMGHEYVLSECQIGDKMKSGVTKNNMYRKGDSVALRRLLNEYFYDVSSVINAITERDLRNIDDASIVYLKEDGTKIEVPCLTIGTLGELYKVLFRNLAAILDGIIVQCPDEYICIDESNVRVVNTAQEVIMKLVKENVKNEARKIISDAEKKSSRTSKKNTQTVAKKKVNKPSSKPSDEKNGVKNTKSNKNTKK